MVALTDPRAARRLENFRRFLAHIHERILPDLRVVGRLDRPRHNRDFPDAAFKTSSRSSGLPPTRADLYS